MDVYPIKPVVRFCGVTAADEASRRRAIERLSLDWGQTSVCTGDLPMDAGGYYAESMGEDLRQVLVAFGDPIEPDGLADWKHHTNDLERLAIEQRWNAADRPINLDCGYITEAKFVLATTKNRSHRVYLRRAMFAEITLTYVGGRWQSNRQTYPNYRTDEVAEFATRCRGRLREWLHRR